MLPVVVFAKDDNGVWNKAYTWCLCDSGSNTDCLNVTLARSLNVKTYDMLTRLTTLSSRSSTVKKYCDIYVSNVSELGGFDMTEVMLADKFQGQGERPPRNSDIRGLKYLVDKGVSFFDLDHENIGLLLSTKRSWVWESGELVKGRPEQPMARRTPLGWLLFGGEDPPASPSAECFGAIKYPRTPLDAYDRDDVHFHPMPGTVVGQSVEEKFQISNLISSSAGNS